MFTLSYQKTSIPGFLLHHPGVQVQFFLLKPVTQVVLPHQPIPRYFQTPIENLSFGKTLKTIGDGVTKFAPPTDTYMYVSATHRISNAKNRLLSSHKSENPNSLVQTVLPETTCSGCPLQDHISWGKPSRFQHRETSAPANTSRPANVIRRAMGRSVQSSGSGDESVPDATISWFYNSYIAGMKRREMILNLGRHKLTYYAHHER